jgi:hypothetical protein
MIFPLATWYFVLIREDGRAPRSTATFAMFTAARRYTAVVNGRQEVVER